MYCSLSVSFSPLPSLHKGCLQALSDVVFNKDMQWVARLSIFMLFVAFKVINVLRCHFIALTPGCSAGHWPRAALTVPFILDRNCYILWPLPLNYLLLFLADCYLMLVWCLFEHGAHSASRKNAGNFRKQ